MERRLGTYLRTQRRRWGFTQSELARLLGMKSATHVSRIERGKRKPMTATILASAVIFGVKATEIFPGLADTIEDEVGRRAYELYQELQGNPSKATKLKLDLLETILKRAAPDAAQSEI
jgi:transcriptional regulator with XRE-family HTH domain